MRDTLTGEPTGIRMPRLDCVPNHQCCGHVACSAFDVRENAKDEQEQHTSLSVFLLSVTHNLRTLADVVDEWSKESKARRDTGETRS